jgi:hypothetical protein
MAETRVDQAISYLTEEIGRLRKDMIKLAAAIRQLSIAVDHAIKFESDALTRESEDNKRIDQFKAYQEGKPTNAS